MGTVLSCPRLRARHQLRLIGSVLVLQACSSASDPGGGPSVGASRNDVVEVCGVICERETRCDTPDPADLPCESECLSETAPGLLRRDMIRGIADCHSQLTCDESEEPCLGRVIRALEPDFESSPLLQRCVEIQNQCETFSDDACSYAIVFTDAGKARLETCLNSGCELVGECIAGLRSGT